MAETNVLVDNRHLGLASRGGLVVDVRLKSSTVVDNSVRLESTCVEGRLEDVDVPAVSEVGVETVTGRVSIRKCPRRSVLVEREVADREDPLVKQRDEVDGVRGGAVSALEVVDGVGHV